MKAPKTKIPFTRRRGDGGFLRSSTSHGRALRPEGGQHFSLLSLSIGCWIINRGLLRCYLTMYMASIIFSIIPSTYKLRRHRIHPAPMPPLTLQLMMPRPPRPAPHIKIPASPLGAPPLRRPAPPWLPSPPPPRPRSAWHQSRPRRSGTASAPSSPPPPCPC